MVSLIMIHRQILVYQVYTVLLLLYYHVSLPYMFCNVSIVLLVYLGKLFLQEQRGTFLVKLKLIQLIKLMQLFHV